RAHAFEADARRTRAELPQAERAAPGKLAVGPHEAAVDLEHAAGLADVLGEQRRKVGDLDGAGHEAHRVQTDVGARAAGLVPADRLEHERAARLGANGAERPR